MLHQPLARCRGHRQRQKQNFQKNKKMAVIFFREFFITFFPLHFSLGSFLHNSWLTCCVML